MRHRRAVRKCAINEKGEVITRLDHVETAEEDLAKAFERSQSTSSPAASSAEAHEDTTTSDQVVARAGETDVNKEEEFGERLANLPATTFEAEKVRKEEAKRAEKLAKHLKTKHERLKIERKAGWAKWIGVLANALEGCFYEVELGWKLPSTVQKKVHLMVSKKLGVNKTTAPTLNGFELDLRRKYSPTNSQRPHSQTRRDQWSLEEEGGKRGMKVTSRTEVERVVKNHAPSTVAGLSLRKSDHDFEIPWERTCEHLLE